MRLCCVCVCVCIIFTASQPATTTSGYDGKLLLHSWLPICCCLYSHFPFKPTNVQTNAHRHAHTTQGWPDICHPPHPPLHLNSRQMEALLLALRSGGGV
uniref:Putative secreted protein n=1 Tax=Anopheles darlingi TaxID=43151 RepID=A0A2M4D7J6_ANODA